MSESKSPRVPLAEASTPDLTASPAATQALEPQTAYGESSTYSGKLSVVRAPQKTAGDSVTQSAQPKPPFQQSGKKDASASYVCEPKKSTGYAEHYSYPSEFGRTVYTPNVSLPGTGYQYSYAGGNSVAAQQMKPPIGQAQHAGGNRWAVNPTSFYHPAQRECAVLPMYERVSVPCNTTTENQCTLSNPPAIRIKLHHSSAPGVLPDLKRFVEKCGAALSGVIDDVERLVCPLRSTDSSAFTPSSYAVQQTHQLAGTEGHYKPYFFPQTGNEVTGALTRNFTVPRCARGVLVPKQEALQRCLNWHCSFFEDIGNSIDQDVLGARLGGVCREFGEYFDKVLAEGIHSMAYAVGGICGTVREPNRAIVEGYAMYEPDPSRLSRERPTMATGNVCIDQVNALLDACLASRRDSSLDYAPPPFPETQKTGNWAIDTVNAVLDFCLKELPPPPPVPPKTYCPLNLLVPPCCRTEEPPPPPPSKPLCQVITGWLECKERCPHCHQTIGECPKNRQLIGPVEPQGGCQLQFCPVDERQVLTPHEPERLLVYPYCSQRHSTIERSVPEQHMYDQWNRTPELKPIQSLQHPEKVLLVPNIPQDYATAC